MPPEQKKIIDETEEVQMAVRAKVLSIYQGDPIAKRELELMGVDSLDSFVKWVIFTLFLNIVNMFVIPSLRFILFSTPSTYIR